MAMEITLCLEDSGEMYIKSGEKEESPEMESAEGGEKIPVKSIDDALAMIKQMADSASMAPPAEGMEEPTAEAGAPMEDPMAEEDAMASNFQQRR
jgi:hypothetical protein